jgi:hypothetical protein
MRLDDSELTSNRVTLPFFGGSCKHDRHDTCDLGIVGSVCANASLPDKQTLLWTLTGPPMTEGYINACWVARPQNPRRGESPMTQVFNGHSEGEAGRECVSGSRQLGPLSPSDG